MDTITISSKFQIVIPKFARTALKLTVGEKLKVLCYADRVELIPVRSVQQMRGFLRWMDSIVEREADHL